MTSYKNIINQSNKFMFTKENLAKYFANFSLEEEKTISKSKSNISETKIDKKKNDLHDILEKDKQVDDDYRSCMRQLLTFMLEDPRTISMSLESMFIAKSLERIGDHAVNISQSVIYTVKGKDVRHSSLKEIKKELS